MPALLAFALVLAVGLRWAIRTSLLPLERLAAGVGQRSVYDLSPVELDVPAEIEPLVQHLNQLLTQISAALEREKRWTADAAHELRTPLAGLRVHAELALMSSSEETRRLALSRVVQGIDRCSALSAGLLDLARLDHASGQLQMQDCSWQEIFERVASELLPLHGADRQRLRLRLAQLPVHGHAQHLRQSSDTRSLFCFPRDLSVNVRTALRSTRYRLLFALGGILLSISGLTRLLLASNVWHETGVLDLLGPC